MRATCATRELENGASLEQVQDLLGQAKPSTTQLYDPPRLQPGAVGVVLRDVLSDLTQLRPKPEINRNGLAGARDCDRDPVNCCWVWQRLCGKIVEVLVVRGIKSHDPSRISR